MILKFLRKIILSSASTLKTPLARLYNVQHWVFIADPPSLAHKLSRVAFDVGEDAELVCRMRAFPKPTFEWTHENNILQGSPGSRYMINSTNVGEDVYASILTIRSVNEGDYGAYTCKATNEEGPSKTKLFLQEKGLPAPPENGIVTNVGVDFIELTFDPVFDGGYPNETDYSARVSNAHGQERAIRCSSDSKCLIRTLRQNTEYRIFLYAVNPRGQSTLSDPIVARTTLDPTAIPAPLKVFVETGSGTVVFSVPKEIAHIGTTLQGRLDVRYENGLDWTPVPAEVDITEDTGMYDFGPIKGDTLIRVQLCTKGRNSVCGPYQNAKHGKYFP